MKFTIDTNKKEITVYSDFEYLDVFKVLDALDESIIDYRFILSSIEQVGVITISHMPTDNTFIYLDSHTSITLSKLHSPVNIVYNENN